MTVKANNDVIEKAIIACMMEDESSLEKGFAEVERDDFSSNNCKRIFSAMEALYVSNQKIDFVSVSSLFGADFITDVIMPILNGEHYKSQMPVYIKSLKAQVKRRKFGEALHVAMKELSDEDDSCFDNLQTRMDAIADGQETEAVRYGEIEVLSAFSEIGDTTKGTPTGFTELDKQINGLRKGNLIVVAGRPSMGKSALAENIALNVALKDKTVVMFSLEMKNSEILKRLICNGLRMSEQEMLQDSMTAFEKAQEFASLLKTKKLYGFDSGTLSITKMQTICRKISKQARGIDLVIVDYIGLMQTNVRKNSSRAQEIGEISHALKRLAQDMDCTVICVAQLNRSAETRAEHEPVMSDLRESGDIEKDADIILFPYRPSVYDEEISPREAKLIIAKNRNGACGSLPLVWIGEQYRFDNPADDFQNDYAESRFREVEDESCPFDDIKTAEPITRQRTAI